MKKLRLAVSSCLMGEPVRYDGGDKRHRFVVEHLSRQVDLIPVCPEVELGLGIPREPIQLEGPEPRLLGVTSRQDHTREMQRFARKRVRDLQDLNIAGYLFKERSPSCGPSGVKVFGLGPRPRKIGTGLFAAAVRTALPHLPVVGEASLDTPTKATVFVARVFAYGRWTRFLDRRFSRSRLAAFHGAWRERMSVHDATATDDLERWLEQQVGSAASGMKRGYSQRHLEVYRSRVPSAKLRRLIGRRPELFEPAERELLAAIAQEGPVR